MLDNNSRGKVIVISSVSGGGKTTLANVLIRNHPELHQAITATSRKPRQGEIPDVHYYFYTPEDFKEKIEKNEFLEYALVHKNYYGVPAPPLFERLKKGKSVILIIDVQGKRSVEKILGDQMISIFLIPPSDAVWEDRLRKRGTDSDDAIECRLREGIEQKKFIKEYDFAVVNDILEVAAGEISAILRQEGILLNR